ncbi:hypothetical protein M2284_005283 [Rhodococcus sp. LBL1]|nr:hypothetical protein [Rhodococcus sp. LBL1]MDH6686346.1 hypothetical protein [Rhodococcus sp. LBL2]
MSERDKQLLVAVIRGAQAATTFGPSCCARADTRRTERLRLQIVARCEEHIASPTMADSTASTDGAVGCARSTMHPSRPQKRLPRSGRRSSTLACGTGSGRSAHRMDMGGSTFNATKDNAPSSCTASPSNCTTAPSSSVAAPVPRSSRRPRPHPIRTPQVIRGTHIGGYDETRLRVEKLAAGHHQDTTFCVAPPLPAVSGWGFSPVESGGLAWSRWPVHVSRLRRSSALRSSATRRLCRDCACRSSSASWRS